MENKIISIDITPDNNTEYVENAGVMWEHNATVLKFKIDEAYLGDYRYYIEYRSLMGNKVRTEYLELNTADNTITYAIPVSMSSLKGTECYFNIVAIDADGNTIQIIKPRKFCLTFDYSPDTDNTLCKVNDFSINALLEAIRLGTFKGDKGDKGDKGEQGIQGEKGEMPAEFYDATFMFENKSNEEYRYDLAYAKTALFFDEPTYIGTFTPKFQIEDDTFYYAIISLDTAVAEGVFPTITYLKDGTLNCGEPIPINRELSNTVGLVFYTTDTTNRVMQCKYDNAVVKARYLRQIIANSGAGMEATFTGFDWGNSYGGEFTVRTPRADLQDKEITEIKENISEIKSRKVISSFAVIGDSFSTYEGWLPENNATWYGNSETQSKSNDVESVKDTWWWQFSKEKQLSLLCNESYSGSCVCNSPNAPRGDATSFVNRAKVHLGEGNAVGIKPDLIFIFGGVNDYNASVDIGEPKYSEWTEEDLQSFAPAYCYLIDYLLTYNPHAQIVCVSAYNCYNNIKNMISTICEHYGLLYIPIRYLEANDVEQSGSHPNKAGMTVIKDTIVTALYGQN